MSITIVFGSPGSGKTTYAVKEITKNKKKVYYNNIPEIKGKNAVYLSDDSVASLGEYTLPQHSNLIVDEASILFNNRRWKSFPKPLINWLKLHRHYKIDEIFFLSQSWDDIDITIKRLATKLIYIRKVGPFTLCRRVLKRVTIEQKTEQIIDGYRFTSPLWLLLKPFKLIGLHFVFPQIDYNTIMFRPFYYKKFNSYDAPLLPYYEDLKGC